MRTVWILPELNRLHSLGVIFKSYLQLITLRFRDIYRGWVHYIYVSPLIPCPVKAHHLAIFSLILSRIPQLLVIPPM